MTKPAQTPGPSPLARTWAERTRRPEQARLAAFWLEAAVLVLFLAASAAPTPLYRVYQARWGFSATTLTAVFAVYVVFLLMTVLILGSLSDHVGRRPVIITALAVDSAACILFLLAHGVGALVAGRALQGVAVGLAATALGAALLDLRPAGSLAPLVTSNAERGPGSRRAGNQRAGPVRPGADNPGVVAAARRPPGRDCPDSRDAGAGNRTPRRPGLAKTGRQRAAPGPGHVRAGRTLTGGRVGTRRLLPVAGTLAGRAVVRLTQPVVGRRHHFPAHRPGRSDRVAFRNSAPIAVMLGGCLGLFGGAAVTIAAIVTSTPALLLLGIVLAGLGFGPGT